MVGRIRPPPCGRAETCWDERFCGCPFPPNGCGTTLHVPSNCLVHEGFRRCATTSRVSARSRSRAGQDGGVLDVRGIHHRCGAHCNRKKGGRALCHPSGRSGGGRSHSSARTHRNRPARCRRRHFRVCRCHRAAGGQYRTHVLVGGGASGGGAGGDCRSPMWFESASGALRRSGSDERYGGSRCCRWSAEHERDTDRLGDDGGATVRLRDTVSRVDRVAPDVRRSGGFPVPRRGVDCSELADQSDRDGTVGVAEPRPGSIGDRERAVRERNRAGGRFSGRRMPTRDQSREDGSSTDVVARRRCHRGLGEPDLRRSERGPRGVGGCGGPSFP